jgi:hypothetical protein
MIAQLNAEEKSWMVFAHAANQWALAWRCFHMLQQSGN